MSADFNSRPSCPLPLGPQAPCLQSSLLSSVLCPSSSARVHLQQSALHLASLLPRQHLHRTAGASALLRSPISPLAPQLPFLPSCSHLFPAQVLLGLLFWFSPNTPSHQLVVLSLGHFFPASLSQCTGTLVTHPSVHYKISSLGPLLGPSVWSLPHPLSPEVSGPERCCSAQFGLCGDQRPCPSCP